MSARYRPVAGEDVLVARHADIAYSQAQLFFFAGADREDVVQEALTGLLIGIRTFQPDRGSSLRHFLGLSVRAWLIAKMKQANKMAAVPLSDAVRHAPADDGEDIPPIIELLPGGVDPHETLVWKEELARLARGVTSLTPLERGWFVHVLNGGQYSNRINNKTMVNKSADNAIQRAREKLRDAA